MLKLKQITLCALGSTDIEGMLNALKKSSEKIEWGAVKLITPTNRAPVKFSPLDKYNFLETHHIEPMNSIDEWNQAIVEQLHKYIETEFALLVHPDGYVINPELWQNKWLKYDWCSSPWPLPTDDYSYRDEDGNIVRVGNSVGLRSKKLLELGATRPLEYHYGNNNEDGHYCCWNRKWLESQGCKFMPFEEAIHFGKEHELPENKDLKTFLFHSL